MQATSLRPTKGIVTIIVLVLAALGLDGCAGTPGPGEFPHQQVATLSQQRMCSERAEKMFMDSYFSGKQNENSYTNHYDARAGVCYVEFTTRSPSANALLYSHQIEDAFEGRVYGTFISVSDYVKPSANEVRTCSIKPRTQQETICKSKEEFDSLALKYFGTTPD